MKDLSPALKRGRRVETSLVTVPNDGVLTRQEPNNNNNGGNHMTSADVEEAPCVEDENWYFVAPSVFTGDLQSMYDGSMEFMLRIAQSSGVERDYHGFITMKSGDGTVLSYKMPGFQTLDRNAWTAYVVVLREDFGWTREADGAPVSTREMIRVMANVTELLVRGDTNVCGGGGGDEEEDGDGREVVYLQNVTMRLPKRERSREEERKRNIKK